MIIMYVNLYDIPVNKYLYICLRFVFNLYLFLRRHHKAGNQWIESQQTY